MEEKEFLNNIQSEQDSGTLEDMIKQTPFKESISYEEELCDIESADIQAEIKDGTALTEGDIIKSDEQAELAASDIRDYLTDLDILAERFPEMRGKKDLASLKNPLRYAALRDLGLNAEEAYLATSGIRQEVRDNRMHLGGTIPRAAASPHGSMSARELREAREIFGNIGDYEIIRLYRKVTSSI